MEVTEVIRTVDTVVMVGFMRRLLDAYDAGETWIEAPAIVAFWPSEEPVKAVVSFRFPKGWLR
jgi:hypothetical protein